MRDEPTAPPKHQLAHELPTVIHHPEDDQTSLARWLARAMENPVRFWGLVSAAVVILLLLSVIGGGLTLGGVASNEAWTRLETAKTAAERVEIAKEFPKTPAERWALLQAATEYYTQGFNDLPANRDVALPNLKKALDLFQKVADEAPKDSPQSRAAALGLARTLEARNDLDRAVKQYETVARTREWAGTPEAREAARLAALLKTPEASTFYKDLYAFKPAEVTLPPGGIEKLNIPGLFSTPRAGESGTGTGAGAGTGGLPDLLNLPPPPPTPAPKVDDASKAEMPAPKAAAPSLKSETPAPKPQGAALPSDVFAPGAAAPKAKDGALPSDVFAPGAAPK